MIQIRNDLDLMMRMMMMKMMMKMKMMMMKMKMMKIMIMMMMRNQRMEYFFEYIEVLNQNTKLEANHDQRENSIHRVYKADTLRATTEGWRNGGALRVIRKHQPDVPRASIWLGDLKGIQGVVAGLTADGNVGARC